MTYNLAATLALFEPCLTQGVSDYFADLNRQDRDKTEFFETLSFREFLSAFVGIDMPERESAPDILEVRMDLPLRMMFCLQRCLRN